MAKANDTGKRPNAGKLKQVDKRKQPRCDTTGRRASHFESQHRGR